MSLSSQKVVEGLRKQKVGMFSERADTTEVLDYALSGLPQQFHPFMTTCLMLYHNTLLELVAKDLENKDARPNSN
jgi:hypothetical protein